MIDPFKMTPEQMAEALEDAAAYVESGWTQGAWFVAESNGVRMCAEGALIAALWGIPEELPDQNEQQPHRDDLIHCPLYQAVVETINEDSPTAEDGSQWPDVPSWNDDEDRTDQEVVDLLHKTAKRVLGVEK